MNDKVKILVVEDELISANKNATSHVLVESKTILLNEDWRKHFFKTHPKSVIGI